VTSPLNEHQRHHILASCQYVDRLLGDLEVVASSASSGSPFNRYIDDLTPAEKRVFRDYCASIRAQMVRVLERHGIDPGTSPSSARHAIRTGLGLIDIALEEMRPQYMRGYGAMADAAIPELNGLVMELQGIVHRLEGVLSQPSSADLQARLARLDQSGASGQMLALIERAIARHGLVEFRPALEAVLERSEDRHFEVAVFGRVSSGKSSLLNHLLGVEILPVGVTPVTAVPTRLERGHEDRVDVYFADRKPERVALARLPDFVTEEGNPDNARHVARLKVTLSSSRLAEGIVVVDTPGLGSLAAEGASETLAYLPRCDVGVVLIDATSPLTPDDVGIVQRLSDAGIPPMVLLSKADLLTPDDLGRVRQYVERQLSSEVGLAVTTRAVSTRASHVSLVDQWLKEELEPLMANRRAVAEASLQRKVGVLRIGVEGALRARLGRRPATSAPPVDRNRIEGELRRAAGLFDDVRKVCEAQRDPPQLVLTEALDMAAERAGTALDYPHSMPGGVDAAVRAAIAQTAADNADDVRRPLGVLVEKVRAALSTASRGVGLPESNAADEWSRLMREMPPFVLGDIHVDVRVALRKMLGKGVAHSRMRSAIVSQAGERIEHALRAHALALHEWSLGVWSRVRDEFNAQADAVRAQMAGPGTGPGGDVGAIEQDLAALEGPHGPQS
jgi:GTP-binding protein EngB required for normal cell division